jgi:hypothetical protein
MVDWDLPTTADVAVLLRARTRDSYGNLQNDFNDQTLPDAQGCQGCIDEAVDEIADGVGSTIPSDVDAAAAKRLVQILAAANVELSYYPEQAAQNNSMYDKLMARYNAKLESLIEEVSLDETAGDGDGAGTGAGIGVGGFPSPDWWGFRPM